MTLTPTKPRQTDRQDADAMGPERRRVFESVEVSADIVGRKKIFHVPRNLVMKSFWHFISVPCIDNGNADKEENVAFNPRARYSLGK